MNNRGNSTVAPFDRDAVANAGYLYTTGARLSSQMANRRLTDAALEAVDFRGQRVLDIGCGDGTYTIELFDRGQPASICGVDPAHKAIAVARQKSAGRNIAFAVENACKLPYEADRFDVVHLRGVLHHMDQPEVALREALRVAPAVVIIEPNGYNPILKLLERLSSYHREHEEKSYGSRKLTRWIGEGGGEVYLRKWVGLVPFFCPDLMARMLKMVEPVWERIPLVRVFGCAVCVMVATRRDSDAGGGA
ncbi:MAG: class I SAM-dependent methyltransferase [Kiritimatiellia bacterium]